MIKVIGYGILSFVFYTVVFTGCTGIVTGRQYTAEGVRKAERAYLDIKDAYIRYKEGNGAK